MAESAELGASVQSRARPMRRRFFSSEPGRTAKCTCPSWSMATTRTTARACLKRAEQLLGLQPPVVIGLQPESVIDQALMLSAWPPVTASCATATSSASTEAESRRFVVIRIC